MAREEIVRSREYEISRAAVRHYHRQSNISVIAAFTNGAEWADAHPLQEQSMIIDRDRLAKGVLISVATSIIQFLDANLAKGNMCLSNMECEDLENAVRNADWMRVYNYMKKKLEEQGKKDSEKADRTMLDKACEWLEENPPMRFDDVKNYVELFRKAMEE